MAKKRYGSLDFLKILATVALVFHHYQQVLEVKFDNFINFYDGALYLGVLVELFFILSGFFMLPWVKRILGGGARQRLRIVRIAAVQKNSPDDGAHGDRL